MVLPHEGGFKKGSKSATCTPVIFKKVVRLVAGRSTRFNALF